ncbi:MAG: glycine cleavage system protein T [Chloroflexi bacterium]|nr:glycine cleavage system protein T [Chloroflexota bacterium]
MWIDFNGKGHLVATDRDRIDLLNRLSTNKLTTLQSGQLRRTVFTNSKARIIDVVTVLHRGDEVLIVTGDNRQDVMENWLRRNIFFNDKFQLTAADNLYHIGVFGEKAAQDIDEDWHLGDLEVNRFVETDNGVIIANLGYKYWLLGPEAALQPFKDSNEPATRQQYDAWRIEQGIPSTTAELTEDYIPLEVGMWDAVNFNKGCYTGQEIIARMESRGKLAKMLVKVSMSGEIPAGTELFDENGKSAGIITSAVERQGLAVVKSALAESGQTLMAEGQTVTVGSPAGHYEPDYS